MAFSGISGIGIGLGGMELYELVGDTYCGVPAVRILQARHGGISGRVLSIIYRSIQCQCIYKLGLYFCFNVGNGHLIISKGGGYSQVGEAFTYRTTPQPLTTENGGIRRHPQDSISNR